MLPFRSWAEMEDTGTGPDFAVGESSPDAPTKVPT